MEEKENKYLNYFKDKDDNYIVRRLWSEETDNYFLFEGTYDRTVLFKKENLEQQIEKELEDICDELEKSVFDRFKITKDSLSYEKIIANFVPEEKYNPLFSHMSYGEAIDFQKDSQKGKLNFAFEFHIKVEKHLKAKALKDILTGNAEKRNL